MKNFLRVSYDRGPYSPKEKMLRVEIWHLFFGDLSQSEKLSEIKLPLYKYSTYVPIVSLMYPLILLLDMNCEVSVVFPESVLPSIKTVYLGVAKDVFLDESL